VNRRLVPLGHISQRRKTASFFAEHQQQKFLQSLEAPCKTRNLGRGVFAYSANEPQTDI